LDGVLDIEITGTGEDGVYQLTFPIEGNCNFHEVGPKQWLIQDSKSRITLLTSWHAAIIWSGLPEGVIGIEMRGQKTMQVRVVTEEIETFYPTAFMEPSYFGDLMVRDFIHPIERFLVTLT